MTPVKFNDFYRLHILDTPAEFSEVEELQRQIWPGNETDIVPGHLMLTAAHNGGVAIGAYQIANQNDPVNPTYRDGDDPQGESLEDVDVPGNAAMVGFVFGFPGLYNTPDGPRLKHCSHMLGVLPKARNHGVGFALKRAQWQIVRHQGIDLITWTYDPLLSRNAHLNIARLGSVCNSYLRDVYGEMRDRLNAGLASDRFQVDWWVNTNRVRRRISYRPKKPLDLAHYLAAGVKILNPSQLNSAGIPLPMSLASVDDLELAASGNDQPILLLEIPADFQAIKRADNALAKAWRQHLRSICEAAFASGYTVIDCVHEAGPRPRSYYVMLRTESSESSIST